MKMVRPNRKNGSVSAPIPITKRLLMVCGASFSSDVRLCYRDGHDLPGVIAFPGNKTVDSIIMLRERTTKAIALLHQAGGISDPLDTVSIDLSDPAELDCIRERLKSSGLLDPSGHLLRPLSSISLYEVLDIVDEGIYPLRRDPDFDELPIPGRLTHRQGMYRTMIRELLRRMKVSEL